MPTFAQLRGTHIGMSKHSATIVIAGLAGLARPLTPLAAKNQAPEPASIQAGRGPGNPR
jgi:hypothetical protein